MWSLSKILHYRALVRELHEKSQDCCTKCFRVFNRLLHKSPVKQNAGKIPCGTHMITVEASENCDASLRGAGIGIAGAADTQLHEFMIANERRKAAGKPPMLLLDTGMPSRFIS